MTRDSETVEDRLLAHLRREVGERDLRDMGRAELIETAAAYLPGDPDVADQVPVDTAAALAVGLLTAAGMDEPAETRDERSARLDAARSRLEAKRRRLERLRTGETAAAPIDVEDIGSRDLVRIVLRRRRRETPKGTR